VDGRWMAGACEAAGLIPSAIDGESARRAKRATATGCLTVVSAWATENRLTLGQVAVPDGSNEIGVIPDLLRTLDLAGAIVTIDAAGCQVENATIIRGQGGHYLLAVKDNQPTLRAAVGRPSGGWPRRRPRRTSPGCRSGRRPTPPTGGRRSGT
jgi:hypothetical protein